MATTDPAPLAYEAVLEDLYATGTVEAADGENRVAHSVVPRDFAEALHRLVLREHPKDVLEVGMANGATSLAIAAALSFNGGGHLVSVDPYQSSQWKGAGKTTLTRAGLLGLCEVVERPDYSALPALLEEGRTFDFAYIDGLHSLEYALLDFFYVDRLLEVGGVVGFNDCDWPAVMPTLRFLERYRKYQRVDSGLPALYGTRNSMAATAYRMGKRLGFENLTANRLVGPLLGRRREDRYYRKLQAWEPSEGFYRPIAP